MDSAMWTLLLNLIGSLCFTRVNGFHGLYFCEPGKTITIYDKNTLLIKCYGESCNCQFIFGRKETENIPDVYQIDNPTCKWDCSNTACVPEKPETTTVSPGVTTMTDVIVTTDTPLSTTAERPNTTVPTVSDMINLNLVYMVWGIISTTIISLGIIGAAVYSYMKCKRNHPHYTAIPSSPCSPSPAFPLNTMTPSPSPPAHVAAAAHTPTPPRLPRALVFDEEEEEYEPVARRTRSQTKSKKNIRYQHDQEEERVLSLLRREENNLHARCLFSGKVKPVTVTVIRNSVRFKYAEGNAEASLKATGQGFLTFLQATKGADSTVNGIKVEPKHVLMWLTGSVIVPAVGFHKMIDVEFADRTFLNTCALSLTLQTQPDLTPEKAVQYYTELLINSQTFTKD